MSLLSVNEKRCQRDGICAIVCPAGLIEMKNEDEIPRMIENGEAYCIRCGHCVAICPHGAMSHSAMKAEQCPPLREDLLPTFDRVEHLIRARRSVRVYQKRQVPRELLARCIEVARFAPSGHNVQPVQWLVIYNREQIDFFAAQVIEWMEHLIREKSPLAERMHLDRVVETWNAGEDRIFRYAPHVIAAHAPKEEDTAPTACAIALAYLELAAFSLNIGACWAGYFNAAINQWPPLLDALALPEGHTTFGAMMIGFSRYSYHRLPLRNDARILWR
ncbi:MAG: 4Fe-4S dicluster domain-containing protein [Desulfobacteraceae bacterium]|nr:MAG: 4Fe-4S dicluster domain-containing protein [Desulfobacteraceae bacterium]